MHRRRFRSRRGVILAALAIFALVAGAGAYATVKVTSSNGGAVDATTAPPTAQSSVAGSGTIGSGVQVAAQTFAAAPTPTPEQAKSLADPDADRSVPAPNRVTQNPTGD